MSVKNPLSIKIGLVSFFIALFISCFSPSLLFAAFEIKLTQSHLLRLAEQLQKEDAARKYDFLHIALQQMYTSYAIEAEKAALERPPNAKKRAKIYRWQISSHQYLDSIENALIQLDIQDNPDFFISKQHKVIVLLDDHPPVIISGPNNGANRIIEQNIVEQFCLLYDCSKYFEKTQSGTAFQLPNPGTEFSGSWTLKRDFKGAFVSDVGLIFNFNNLKQRKAKEQWMSEVYRELLVILDALQKAKNKAYTINWSVLKLEPLPVTDQAYKLLINTKQQFLKVNVPLLGKANGLLNLLKPWLKYYYIKSDYKTIVIEHSEAYRQTQPGGS